MQIIVLNWKKHNNKRKDVITNLWFKVNNDILERPDMIDATNTQIVIWLYILSARSRSTQETVIVSIKHACFFCKCSETEFSEALRIFEVLKMIEVIETRNVDVTQSVTRTSRVRNVDVTQSVTAELELELEKNNTLCRPERLTRLKPNHSDKILNIWNLHRGKLPAAKAISGKRKSSCDARLKENPDENYWAEIVKRLANSDFCCGENDRSWVADFDFLLKPETQFKVLEGKYDNKKTKAIVPRTMLSGEEY